MTPFKLEGPANAGDMVELACQVPKGDRPVTVAWLRNGSAPAEGDGVATAMFGAHTRFLTIASVTPGHAGSYTCRATNAAGVAEHTAYLEVNGTERCARAAGLPRATLGVLVWGAVCSNVVAFIFSLLSSSLTVSELPPPLPSPTLHRPTGGYTFKEDVNECFACHPEHVVVKVVRVVKVVSVRTRFQVPG